MLQFGFVLVQGNETSPKIPSVDLPCEIESRLYLGGQYTAQNKELLDNLGIKAIVNCCIEMKNIHQSSFSYHRTDLEDTMTQNIMPAINPTLSFIRDHVWKGNKVLVHCAQGQSRSGSMIVAWIMLTHGFTLDKAMDWVREKKGDVQPNPNFMNQLREFEVGRGGRTVADWPQRLGVFGDPMTRNILPIVKSGYLMKKGGGKGKERNWLKVGGVRWTRADVRAQGGRRNWKRRFVILTDRYLQYFSTDGDDKPKGSLLVAHDWDVRYDSEHDNAIIIRTPDRDFLMRVCTLHSAANGCIMRAGGDRS